MAFGFDFTLLPVPLSLFIRVGPECDVLVLGLFLFSGPRGPLGTPLSVRPSVGKKNLDQLYSSINHHRTTANLSDIVWCMSGSVWWCLEYVWWCLVASDACLVVSGGVNVYRLI